MQGASRRSLAKRFQGLRASREKAMDARPESWHSNPVTLGALREQAIGCLDLDQGPPSYVG